MVWSSQGLYQIGPEQPVATGRFFSASEAVSGSSIWCPTGTRFFSKAGGNTAYSWARIPLPAPFRESSPRPRAVVSPTYSSQGGTLQIPANLALGAGPSRPPPGHTHTHPPPALCRNSVLASLDSQLSTSSGSRERPANSPAHRYSSTHNRLSGHRNASPTCLHPGDGFPEVSWHDTRCSGLHACSSSPRPPPVPRFCTHLCTQPLAVAAVPPRVSSPCLEATATPGPGAPRTSQPSGLRPHLLQRGPRPPSKLVLWGRVPHLWAVDWYLLSDQQQHWSAK